MNTTPVKELPARRTAGGVTLGQDRSAAARRSAAAILEVLAGTRTPGQAASALGLSLPGYYQLEGRALRGLLAGCEPPRRGRGRQGGNELATLKQQHERLQRELARQQGLVRLAQRAVGLAAPPPVAAKAAGKRRRRPVTRALTVAGRLQKAGDAATEAALAPPVTG